MANLPSVSTRVAGDLAAAASSVAALEHRSIADQINYWTRIGMQMERSASVVSRAVLEAASGARQFSELTSDERRAAHALVDARIATRVSEERFGSAARAAGQTVVALDDDGTIIEISPDGSRRAL